LETEAAHLKAMQELIQNHENITDTRLTHWETIITGLIATTDNLVKISTENTVNIAALGSKIDKLVDGMLHTGGNGKPTA
jgi:hypothetical protein